ncbi:heptaprenyl diphosphate synthase component II [Virgibacillus dakarensis]|uniref:Heptaprenyl diphosphate synthase component 2 n=1 Tax=Lentibacillus populi TaxID=1827502 RepID=A0A9W5TW65_9BACI|nr:heptaprenyl diphosphate synthase component II [Lentibacillus populi]MBT2214268.1 heptaprenyl diphosphate synthase component II [Virgibacillus dakarensis]MTW85907.1 heptaprenyl diphosphate synthase component II [Virgibacillus dakarensis]GGB33497.1 heptaprenyl diphosphate synthase component 2 [Lentibacillus populi]
MKIAKTYGYLKKDLDCIEVALSNVIQAEHPVLRNAATQLLKAGGKRIRPVFVLLSGQFGNYDLERMKTVAVSLELIHMATLVHDDVIDDAELRRGKPTIRQLYDNRVAMYAGDYILARSLESITMLRKPKAHHVLSKTIVEVCIGEIEQIKDKYDWNQHLRDYLRRIKRKTALLIATSCKLGAIAADVPEALADKLYKYGYYIGMSYQIIDDIFDFTASASELGKPVGNDLLQGNITLPVLLAMKDREFCRLLKNAFSNPDILSETHMHDLLAKLKETDAIQCSYELSDHYLEKALKIVEQLPNNKAKHMLKDIAKYIGKRRS